MPSSAWNSRVVWFCTTDRPWFFFFATAGTHLHACSFIGSVEKKEKQKEEDCNLLRWINGARKNTHKWCDSREQFAGYISPHIQIDTFACFCWSASSRHMCNKWTRRMLEMHWNYCVHSLACVCMHAYGNCSQSKMQTPFCLPYSRCAKIKISFARKKIQNWTHKNWRSMFIDTEDIHIL